MTSFVFRYLTIEQLNARQLHQILQVRQEVFVVEQECAYQDCDDIDLTAIHVLGVKGHQLRSYCRVYTEADSVHIGRVLVTKAFRKAGVAKKMMADVLGYIFRHFSHHQVIKLSAQSHLIPFYSEFGFVSVGTPYIEDGIPHQYMVRQLELGS